ncbi:MAG: hypothetical protein J7K65_03930 [Planctomycetes bacterium]|nr:hypothetical protein [Planctomycetota bacterium]
MILVVWLALMPVGRIESCHSSCAVSSNGQYVGGLVGLNDAGQIQTSYATGNVHGNDEAGVRLFFLWCLH